MTEKKSSPLRAAFWLTAEEKRYVLLICALFLLGLMARYVYLKNRNPTAYVPPTVAETQENPHE